ncbi:hypothetical protein KDH_61620 [Dictyobacter sp. S3.2.2.5]|uniref:CHRD domain-containing protein n=1 Tax=Dictyobacter halimunensis TaxID=3026934 RepID=A0ABQ6G0E8_9CHLR|nr:hypothetical protein KDH_61620 [Dictyobacter sp. S3.2.2.5]
MFKSSRKRSAVSRAIAISTTLCTLILMTVFIALSNNARAAVTQTEATPVATGTSSSTGAGTTGRAMMMHTPNGVIRMTYNASNKSLMLTPNIIGLTPNSSHPLQIEQGTCASAGAAAGSATSTATTPVATATKGTTTTPSAQASPTTAATATTGLYSTTLTADATGRVQNSATITNVSTPLTASNLRAQLYTGAGTQKTALSCGDIKPYNPSSATATGTAVATSTAVATGTATGAGGNTFAAQLGPVNNPNEKSAGIAQLSVNNGTLTVQLNVRGLAPNSSHSAHIHNGTCPTIGSVLYNLGTLTADAQGNATVTKTFPNVTSIPDNKWAAQVHYGTDLSNQSQYNPIMCGTVHTGTSQPSATATP